MKAYRKRRNTVFRGNIGSISREADPMWNTLLSTHECQIEAILLNLRISYKFED
jgi:hypothetical protein